MHEEELMREESIDILLQENDEEALQHYGTPRHSGRYPWGSGEDPYQHESWYNRYRELAAPDPKTGKKRTETQIAAAMGISTTKLRALRKAAVEEDLAARRSYVRRLYDKGMSKTAIAEKTGWNESQIRALLNAVEVAKEDRAQGTANRLLKMAKEKQFIDIGEGVEREMGVSKETLKAALALLEKEGYTTVTTDIQQAGNADNYTTVKVLVPSGTTRKDVWENIDKIQSFVDYSEDGGKTWETIKKPTTLDRDRVLVRYLETGGAEKDGTIELRPGVNDLTLGDKDYAQVRIMVDGGKEGLGYMKGMAFYSNDIPAGYDVVYNVSKKDGATFYKVFKVPKVNNDGKSKIENDKPTEAITDKDIDWDNAFGALIKGKGEGQNFYLDANGKEQLSPINIIKAEGDWNHYQKKLASQFLSKQSKQLIKQQLELSIAEKADEFDEYMHIDNAIIRNRFLKDFADQCDSDAVKLKAAACPGQTNKVILPINSLKDTEVYAPDYADGTQVALVRYPHAGRFEIPMCTVNNRNKEGKDILGNAPDAIGINTKVAARLSGADFDGDTVVVIPQSSKVKVLSDKPLKGLVGWADKMGDLYPEYPGMKVMTDSVKQKQMGIITNLITDMSFQNATPSELERAVKQSMIVIDAQKHRLNWKQSEKDLGIDALKQKYQPKEDYDESGKYGGASTLISRSKSEVRVDKRDRFYDIDPVTGERVWQPAKNSSYPVTDKKTGEVTWKKRQQKSDQMTEARDARELSSGHPVEEAYAEYANALKQMANKARLETLKEVKYDAPSKELKKQYATELASIDAKLDRAAKNAPRERIAQVEAAAYIRKKTTENPYLKEKEYKDDLKKLKQQSIAEARAKNGASKKEVFIELTPKEWEAVNKKAVSKTKLVQVTKNMDKDYLVKSVIPKQTTELSQAKVNRIKALSNSGNTISEIANVLGISPSTVSKYLK